MARRTYFVKALRLVLPPIAQQWGLPAEAPTFVSPYTAGIQRCAHCASVFSPLAYQVGYQTRSQHYHDDCGGIYFFVTTNRRVITSLAQMTGFLAEIEPIGQMSMYRAEGGDRCGRAEAVACTQISAYCAPWVTTCQCRPPHWHELRSLSEGLLIEQPPGPAVGHQSLLGTTAGDLLPICNHPDGQGDPLPVRFRFQIRAGTVSFSEVARP